MTQVNPPPAPGVSAPPAQVPAPATPGPPPPNGWFDDTAAKLAISIEGTNKEATVEGLVAGVVEQMYAARQAFISDAHHALATIVICFSAAGALLLAPYGFEDDDGDVRFICHAMSVALFLLTVCLALPHWGPVRGTLSVTLQAGYNLYVASVIHAAMVFRALRMPPTHAWIATALRCTTDTGRFWRQKSVRLYDHWKFEPDPSAVPAMPDWAAPPHPLTGPPEDQKEGVSRRALSIGELTAVWCSGRPNLESMYNTLLAFCCGAALLAAAVATGITCGDWEATRGGAPATQPSGRLDGAAPAGGAPPADGVQLSRPPDTDEAAPSDAAADAPAAAESHRPPDAAPSPPPAPAPQPAPPSTAPAASDPLPASPTGAPD